MNKVEPKLEAFYPQKKEKGELKLGVKNKLLNVQQELKAPKNAYNSFGRYKYRSAEMILEAVKPVLAKYECFVTLSDKMIQIGDRYYVEATATFHDVEFSNTYEVKAYAREPQEKKGMDDSQITGTASSYARKYALNGLFAIDDTKDADTDEYQLLTGVKKQASKPKEEPKQKAEPSKDTILMEIQDRCFKDGVDEKWLSEKYKVSTLDELVYSQLEQLNKDDVWEKALNSYRKELEG